MNEMQPCFFSGCNSHSNILPDFNSALNTNLHDTLSVDTSLVKSEIIPMEEAKSFDEEDTTHSYLNLFLDGGIIHWLLKTVNEDNNKLNNYLVTEDELRCFISIIYLSGYLEVPRRRLLWERSLDCHNALVCNAIQRDRFEYIFNKLSSIQVEDESGVNINIVNFNNIINNVLLSHCPVDNQYGIGQINICGKKGAKAWCGTDKYGYCNFINALINSDVNSVIMQYAKNLKQYKVPALDLLLFIRSISPTPQLLHDLKEIDVKILNSSENVQGCILSFEKLQSNVNLYQSKIRAKPGFLQYFTFCLDIILCNAYMLYKNKLREGTKQLDTLGFRRNIVVYLLERHGKPIVSRKLATNKSTKRNRFCESRFDGIRHYVIPQEKQTRCGHCSQKTTTRCQKCNVGVHVRCFIIFHTRSKS